MTYGSSSAGGRKLGLSVGDWQTVHEIQKTGSFDKFREFDAGTIRLSAKGPVTLSVRPIDAPRGLLINLKRVRLEPKR